MARKTKKEPSLLPHVVQAVGKLKDDDGSTASRIVCCVQAILKKADIKVKEHKLASHVEKAIQHAVDAGLLKLKPGRYLLGSQCSFDVNSTEPDKDKATKNKQTVPDATPTKDSIVSDSATDDISTEETEERQSKSRKRQRTDSMKNSVPSRAATPEPEEAAKYYSAGPSHGHSHKRKKYGRG